MASFVGNRSLCDICYDQECFVLPSARGCENENDLQCKEEVSRLFPGCETNKTLNRHLKVYFIMTRLLKLPSTQFLKQLLKSSPSSTTELKRGGARKSLQNGKDSVEEDRLLYSNICTKCEQIVDEAFDLHQKAVTLQHKIDKLGETLFELKEMGQLKKLEEHGVEKKSTSKEDEMLNLSLACLGGDMKITNKPEPPKRSIKAALRKRKACSDTKSTKISKGYKPSLLESERDPLESVSISHPYSLESSTQQSTKNEFQIKTEHPEEVENEWISDEAADDAMDTMEVTPEVQTEKDDNAELGNDLNPGNAEFEDDNPDSDEDYVPTQPTDEDEEMEDDADDGDYLPEKYEKRGKGRKKKSLTDVETMAMDSSDASDNDDDDLEKMIVLGGGCNTTRDMTLISNPSKDNAATTTTPYEFQCPQCSRVFSLRSCLRAHTKKMHGFEMHYRCPKCPDLEFIKKKDLVDHRKQVHGYVCQKCGKKLSKAEALIEHYKRIHKIQFTFTCPLCKEGFKTRNALRKHRSTAHIPSKEEMQMLSRCPENEEEKMWASNPCSECGKVFFAGEKLDMHLITQHEYKMTKAERKAIGKRCYFCWKFLKLEQRHWIHRKMAHPDKQLKFPCDLCTEKTAVFETTSELLAHFQTDHAEETIHVCNQCKWPFIDERLLRAHRTVHVNKKQDPDITDSQKMQVCKFNCWFCWELFPTKEKLQRHLKISTRHRKNFKFEFPCEDHNCRSLNPFKSVEDLEKHFNEAHEGNEVFTCDRCNWSFLSQNMLTLHKINHVPRRASQYKCPECEHISGILPALRDHYNRNHGLHLKIHKCEDCNERYETKKAMTIHRIQMHDKYNEELSKNGFPCDQCGKMFRTEQAVKGHQYQNHADLKCPECQMPFQKKHQLKLHRQRVHGFGDRFLCPVCGNECLDKPLLLKHMERHREAWFECHLCGIKMRTEESLKKHVKKIHENEKPKPNQKFVCKICGRGYSRKDSLDDHVRVKHSQDSHRVWECSRCGKRFKREKDLEAHNKSDNACRTRYTLLDGADKKTSQVKTEENC